MAWFEKRLIKTVKISGSGDPVIGEGGEATYTFTGPGTVEIAWSPTETQNHDMQDGDKVVVDTKAGTIRVKESGA